MPSDLLPEARSRALMQACLRAAPPGPLRLFAYGSLIWERGFPHVAALPSRLPGFVRRYGLWDESNRGTLAAPSLTLGLELGDGCGGVTFTLPDAEALWPAWKQEMKPGGYTAAWVSVVGVGPALTFLTDRTHRLYAGRRPDEAALIADGHGANGSAIEYLHRTAQALRREGQPDPMLDALEAAIGPRAAA
jgi:cation transport protein ChaC